MKVAVVSDLHIYDDDSGKKPSYIQVGGESSEVLNPISALEKLIEDQTVTADFLICAGDLTDKANPKGLREGWRMLQGISQKLGAQLIGTAGNHDLDSRLHYNDHDAKGVLQSLTPRFPLDSEEHFDFYWSRNFVLYEDKEQDAQFLILNSAAYHGYNQEYLHGRVSDQTISFIKEKLEGASSKKANILVCHHHPHKHGDIEDDGYSSMVGGEKLIDLLASGEYGEWIIIHGHKHIPRVCYASGGTSSPVVFSAGSFSAVLYDEIQGMARNQFYIIDIPTDEYIHDTIIARGEFTAWDWIPKMGIQTPGKNSGLPHNGGFGFRGSTPALAKKIAKFIAGDDDPYHEMSSLKTQFPELNYVIPIDTPKLVSALEREGIIVMWDEVSNIQQMAKGE